MGALTLIGQRSELASPARQREHLAALELPQTFESAVARTPLGVLKATGIEILQINVGKLCNQTCSHCHVDAGPDRKEVMPDDVLDACLDVLARSDIELLDITGGAPELHPRFRELVERATDLGRRVIDRCNLTILTLPKYRDLPRFLAQHKVEVVCSLPHFTSSMTDTQRGDGVFDLSIAALRTLNDLGYGVDGSGLELTLITNPVGALLPAPQAELEADFRRELRAEHGVEFTRLLAITNMPISRYLDWLEQSGTLACYMNMLAGAFNGDAAAGVMCRDTLSVAWDGGLYDCDFNQMLDIPVSEAAPQTIFDFDAALLGERRVQTGPHCFGCTAAQGSSCGGATT